MSETVNRMVTGVGPDALDRDTPGVPLQHATAMATQSVAQSMAMAVADATDMLRNVETVMTTAIGVVMAKWIEEPDNALYEQILRAASQTMVDATELWTNIGLRAGKVLSAFPSDGGDAAPSE